MDGELVGPLEGLRIVEFAGIGPAPFCAMVLSDLGADVITVHRPVGPVVASSDDPLVEMTAGILARGRRSVAIDLKHPDGVAAALELVGTADGLIEGFRPGVMERLGLGPDDCSECNSRLVYGRMTGWGQSGPNAQRAGHDVNYLALSGVLAHIGRRDEPPAVPLNLIGDFGGGGLLLALGMVCGILEAKSSGKGQTIDAAMVDGAALQMTMMYDMLGRGMWVSERESNMNDGGAHFYGVYETADHRYVSVGAMEPKFYATLLSLLDQPADGLPDQWDARSWPECRRRFSEIFRQKTRAEWCDLLEGSDACFAPVLTMTEALVHPHAVARDGFVEVGGIAQPAPAPRFSRTPAMVARPGARVGEHTEEVFAEAGMSPERFRKLCANGAIAPAVT
jgi:alpha-methylacyl-CoA racemase